ncbi:MAG TPA: histidine phosphatase family protein [Rhizomicrobium sp.]|nr:histidine phosphatase family protein [Rhizomicrobium sp.]
MQKLLLIKHAPPRIDPAVPSPRWTLSDPGRERCGWLAGEMKAHGVTRLFASLEPKALETAALAATRLGLAVEPRAGLEENDRTGFGFGTEDELRAAIRAFFDRPSEIVMGRQSADTAYARYRAAVAGCAASAAGAPLAIVTHGTVLTLLTSRHNTLDPFDFWASLRLPSYIVLDAANFRLDGPVHNYPPDPP